MQVRSIAIVESRVSKYASFRSAANRNWQIVAGDRILSTVSATTADRQLMEITLPLWIIHPEQSFERIAPAEEPCSAPDHSLAFSNSHRLTQYLEARDEGK